VLSKNYIFVIFLDKENVMKQSLSLLTGLLLFSFLGCSTHNVQQQKSTSTVEKSKVKKSLSKEKQSPPKKVKSPQQKEKKIIDDYQSTIYENIAKSKAKKKQLEILELKKEKLLQEMEVARAEFAKTEDKKSFIKKRDEITKKLNRITKEYEALKSQNEIINYSQTIKK
jgi:hypothetical protein